MTIDANALDSTTSFCFSFPNSLLRSLERDQGGQRPSRTSGRPTNFNDKTLDRLCAALADGMPIKGACVVAGIGVTTLAEWHEKHPRLEDRMSEARERARQKAL
jgi:hypothetical protein